MRALVLVAPALAACLDNSAALPDVPTPTSPIAFTELDAGGVATVATGGVQIVSIADPLAIGLSAETTAGYDLVPFGGAWPNAQVGQYTVHALGGGDGAFSIDTAKGIAAGPLASADVDRVVVRPAAYRLDSASFAIDPNRLDVEVALFDASDRRLVDGSVAIAGAGAGVSQAAWDRATLPATLGSYTLTVTGDSFAPQSATVAVTSTIDRTEQTIEDGRVCYHAFAGQLEVATVMTSVVSPDPAATNCELAK